MKRILILGNSGSGKTTLATALAHEHGLAHLDLDQLAWLPTDPPQRAPLESSGAHLREFTKAHDAWVIEGCYTDLLILLERQATEVVFLNLSLEDCIQNARDRPWEPHKYDSREAQDRNLEMLISWIGDYRERADSFSFSSHLAFFEGFAGTKVMYRDNARRDS